MKSFAKFNYLVQSFAEFFKWKYPIFGRITFCWPHPNKARSVHKAHEAAIFKRGKMSWMQNNSHHLAINGLLHLWG